MSVVDTFKLPLLIYFIWQVSYFVKTEFVDKKKLESDQDIMTSSRWMTVKKPHPIWKFFCKRGYNISAPILLQLVQTIYTFITVLPMHFIFENFWLHCVWLSVIFVCCVWNGASYYFEAFTNNYTDRIYTVEKSSEQTSLPSTPSNIIEISSTNLSSSFIEEESSCSEISNEK